MILELGRTTTMSGMNSVMKLKSQGVDAKQDTQPKVSVFDIHVPIDGLLAHPRANDAIDEDLLTNERGDGIMDRGEVEEPVCVRRDGMHDGKMRLTLIYGSRRRAHLIEAVRRWKEQGVFRDEQKYIKLVYFVGDDKAALLHRQAEDSRPTKKAHSPSVLAFSAKQMMRAKCTVEEILAVMPRSVRTKADLEALLRWDDLTVEAAQKFDQGAPLALLGTVLDAPREKQGETIAKLVEAGATTSNKAGRVVNREARANGTKAANPITPKQIRALTVGANKLGRDKEEPLPRLPSAAALAKVVDAAMADGFAMLGKLLTQEIKVDDLPEHLRDMAREVLNKK
jgi:hypothetical protein